MFVIQRGHGIAEVAPVDLTADGIWLGVGQSHKIPEALRRRLQFLVCFVLALRQPMEFGSAGFNSWDDRGRFYDPGCRRAGNG